MRPHVAAVYAFARVADDIADEGHLPAEKRLARLDAWQRRLHGAVAVEQSSDAPHAHEDLIIVAIAHTIRALDLPIALFDDLLSAFGQDTMTNRYASWEDVLDYCRRSANPVGRLVLRIAGYRDDRLDRSSDALCTALQLTNFWQDFGRDWRAGRLYVPREVQHACGASEDALVNGPLGDEWQRALAACVAVTAEHFTRGRDVCDGVRGRLRFELRLTWLGGRRILDRVDAARANLLDYRPTIGVRDAPLIAWRTAQWGIRG
jgi:phytoene synthase